MLTFINKYDIEQIISIGAEEARIVVYPNPINKFSLYLAGASRNGCEIQGVGPMAIRANPSLYEYSNLVGIGLSNGYRVFITKEGGFFRKGDWFIEFRSVAT